MRAVPGFHEELDFADPGLFAGLENISANLALFHELPFGLVGMDVDGIVFAYNRFESECAEISAEQCIGLNFFSDVAPCTNNYLESGRLEDESTLDETIDYVFALKMRPTRVALRKLKSEPSEHQYLAIRRR